MDKNELKVQALLERVSSLTASYESQAADYRVEITLLSAERDHYKAQAEAAEARENAPTEVPVEDSSTD